MKVLVSIPPSYPATSPPQLQLLSRYIGAFSADSNLFGSVLRTFISSNGVEWVADTVCVFDGLQNVLDRCLEWYQDRLSAEKAGALVREDARDAIPETQPRSHSPSESPVSLAPQTTSLPDGIRIYEAEPITDRKSSFVGRACAITDPSQVWHLLCSCGSTHLLTICTGADDPRLSICRSTNISSGSSHYQRVAMSGRWTTPPR